MKKIILCALLLVSVVNISWAEDYDEREEHSLAHKLRKRSPAIWAL